MRVPIRWLKEYVEITLSTDELADRLTMAGLEVSAIDRMPSGELDWQNIVVGEVIEVSAHPDADRLVVAQVNTDEGTFTSVTGAPNIKVGQSGMRVPVAMMGAKLLNAYEPDPPTIEVKGAKLRGVDSQVVLCSEKELGLSDNHDGVLILDDDTPIGTTLIDLLGDEVLDIELTPNLGRCLSIIGVAREVAVLTNSQLTIREPDWKPTGQSIEGQAQVVIEDPDLCPRYTASIIRDVKIGPAPFWIRYRLMLAGMRPISNIVDITNYVMLEWGQPLHAFDYDILRERAGGAPTITVRRAHSNEKMRTLDDVERTLENDMLMIADSKGSIALGGVMGGLETEVVDTSKNILLEAANFHPINNRRTSTKLNLPSEASHRYSRGVPAEHAALGSKRASQLMREYAAGVIDSGLIDIYSQPPSSPTVKLPVGECDRLLGIEVGIDQVCEILNKLDFETEVKGDEILVKVPYYRLDVEIPADLVEEVARVLGYDNLPATRMSDQLPRQNRNRMLETEEQIKDMLCGLGLTEVINYSLTSPESVAKLNPASDYDLGQYIELANPISTERSHMRKTLSNMLLENVASNSRHSERIAIFEVGRLFLPNELDKSQLPNEPLCLGIALSGNRTHLNWTDKNLAFDFYDMKGIVEELLSALGHKDIAYTTTEHPTYHPGRAAKITIDGHEMGLFGELHPQVAKNFDLPQKTFLAEINLEALAETIDANIKYRPIPRYPGIRQDLALVVDESITSTQIASVIWKHGEALVESIDLFDLYHGEQVPEGKKSLAYSLYYRAKDRTLTDDAVQKVHVEIQNALESQFGAQIRGVGV